MPVSHHRDRSRPRVRRARVATVAAALTAALVAGPITIPAWAASPTDTAVTPLDLPADAPAAQSDPLGAPAANTMIQSDKLLVQPADRTNSATAYTVSTSGAQPVQVASGQTEPVPDLHANFPTASGRFLDNRAERVLALHHSFFDGLVLSDATATVSTDGAAQDGAELPTWSIPMPLEGASLPSDLAVGDLDRAVSAADTYGDEAAVAYVDGAGKLHVAIVDYNQPGGLISTDVTGFTNDQITGMVGVEIADFDGDSENEIAVVSQNSAGVFKVAFISYDAPNQTTVKKAETSAAFAAGKSIPVSTVYAVAAGDFAGLDRAQLAVSYTEANLVSVWLETASFTDDLSVASTVAQPVNDNPRAHDISMIGGCVDDGAGRWCSVTHRLESVFLAAGSDVSDTGRHQLVFALPTMIVDTVTEQDWLGFDYDQWRSVPYSCYYVFGADTKSATDPTLVSTGRQGATCLEYAEESFSDPTEDDTAADRLDFVKKYSLPRWPPLQLAPGGYAGRDVDSGEAARWGIATIYGKTGQMTMLTWDPTAKALRATATSLTFDPMKGATLTGYDQDNTSLRLGAPLVINMHRSASPVMIAAAPPVHMDWLYDETTGKSGLDTYSWSSKTFLALETEKDKENTTSVTTTTATSVGNAVSTSIKTAWEAGVPFVGKTDLSMQLKVALSVKSDEATDVETSGATSISRKTSSETINDDLLVMKSTSVTVYRYPIIGEDDCNGTCQNYFDVAIPSTSVELQSDVPGRSLDWYQPTWLNGNALSYPQAVEEPGAYTVIANGTAIPKAGLIDQMFFTPGGVKTSKTITVSEKTGSNTTVTADTTFAESEEFKASAEAEVGLGVKSKTKVKFNQSFDAEQRFGSVTVGKTESTSS